jgi:hypothetical protein
MVMNLGCSAAGLALSMCPPPWFRVKAAALEQDDAMFKCPSFRCIRRGQVGQGSDRGEEDMPAWGSWSWRGHQLRPSQLTPA